MIQRKTARREAIRQAFLSADHPLRVGEVLELGRRDVPSLNQATVYRNLKELEAKGWLLKVHHPTLGTLYERADCEHHHNFYCRRCAKVFALAGCPINAKAASPPGFVTEAHELFLFGLCPGCAAS